jgi:hypothetical protein
VILDDLVRVRLRDPFVERPVTVYPHDVPKDRVGALHGYFADRSELDPRAPNGIRLWRVTYRPLTGQETGSGKGEAAFLPRIAPMPHHHSTARTPC